MPDQIFIADAKANELRGIPPVAFAAIGLKERRDLERWIIAHPHLLGENLLIVTSEFDKFDGSSKRLDLLALDEDGNLVVVELKRDAEGTLADLQGIRYAAFCSLMTMQDIVRLYARFKHLAESDAEHAICSFLKVDELPELAAQPRIIIAAGSIDDQELTSCVLWLRQFGVNISCVELTPFLLPDDKLAIVPRVVIPLPETRDFQIGMERRETAEARAKHDQGGLADFWNAIGTEFNKLETGFCAPVRGRGSFMQVTIGVSTLHYEWLLRRRDQTLEISLHAESSDRTENQRWLDPIAAHAAQITAGIPEEFDVAEWGRAGRQARFRLRYDGKPTSVLAPRAAELMALLIARTYPLIPTSAKN